MSIQSITNILCLEPIKATIKASRNDSILTYRVTKSNDLVQSKSDFTAIQHRIILLALVQIKPKDKNLRTYIVQVSDVIKSQDSQNYHIVKKSIKKLENTTIGIQENCVWIDYPFIQNVQLVKKNKVSFVEITFSKRIEKFLIDIKGCYTTYTLANVINFKHNYSLRIYELCKQYEGVKSREISLDYLRTILNLKTKYKNFSHFKSYVLTPSLTEINKHSDLSLKIREYTENQKVTGLKFSISHNKEQQLPSNFNFKELLSTGFDHITKARLSSLGFTIDAIYKLEKQYSNLKTSKVLNLYYSQTVAIKNPLGWIVSALKKDFRSKFTK